MQVEDIDQTALFYMRSHKSMDCVLLSQTAKVLISMKPFICSLSQFFFQTPRYAYTHAYAHPPLTAVLHLAACVQFKGMLK